MLIFCFLLQPGDVEYMVRCHQLDSTWALSAMFLCVCAMCLICVATELAPRIILNCCFYICSVHLVSI